VSPAFLAGLGAGFTGGVVAGVIGTIVVLVLLFWAADAVARAYDELGLGD
jgi:hypothetical protein